MPIRRDVVIFLCRWFPACAAERRRDFRGRRNSWWGVYDGESAATFLIELNREDESKDDGFPLRGEAILRHFEFLA